MAVTFPELSATSSSLLTSLFVWSARAIKFTLAFLVTWNKFVNKMWQRSAYSDRLKLLCESYVSLLWVNSASKHYWDRFTPDALPEVILYINPGLGLAQENTKLWRTWLDYLDIKASQKNRRFDWRWAIYRLQRSSEDHFLKTFTTVDDWELLLDQMLILHYFLCDRTRIHSITGNGNLPRTKWCTIIFNSFSCQKFKPMEEFAAKNKLTWGRFGRSFTHIHISRS